MDKHVDELRTTAKRLSDEGHLDIFAFEAAMSVFSFEQNGIVLSKQEALKIFAENAVPVDTSFR